MQTTLFEDDTHANDHKLTPQNLLDLWNDAADRFHLSKARSLGDGARAHRVAKLLTEFPYASYWQEVIERIGASDFCRGLIPGKDFLADFEFFTRLETHRKVLDGRYDNRDNCTREQFRATQRRHMNETLRGRSVTIITGSH